MNSFKKFFSKKKVNRHFKNSGGGVRLDSGEGGSSSQPSITSGSAQGGAVDRVAAADIAAQAALKRMLKNEPQQDASKKRIQMLAKRELEAERRQLEGLHITEEEKPTTDAREFDHSSAITHVLFTCELLGEDIAKSKNELLEDIKHFLVEQVDSGDDDSDKMIAAVLMIYSLNKTNVREVAVETISKYLQNILTNPGEEKYKSIRLSNKAFQERVDSVIGGRKFLQSVGFVEETRGEDTFLYFSSESDTHLIEALESLKNGQSVPIKVARNLEIFAIQEGQQIKTPKLADDFFNLSADEVKKEQKSREAQVERMLTLRTKEMRAKDEQLTNYRYKYTLIRVRMPGNLLVQGVFGCHETFAMVRSFVASIFSDSAACSEFTLRDASGQRVEDESTTLAHLGLAPAAVLHLDFTELPEVILSDEYVGIVQTFEN